MLTSKFNVAGIFIVMSCFLPAKHTSAHNGKIAHAFPVGKIVVDGDFSDWPKGATKYIINTVISDTRPQDDEDFSGFFCLGYNVANKSLYIAFTIVDNDFIEDTTDAVRFNTQDCLELSIDGRHLPIASGVASFMYSKKLRNINLANFDPFAKKASWDMMDVAMTTNGNKRYYEWRINLGEEFMTGKSIGFDFTVFDKDNDGTFTFSAWGPGGYKYRDPGSLGDILLLKENQKLAIVSGTVGWDRKINESLPSKIQLRSITNKNLWLAALVDSSGKYSAEVPADKYEVKFRDAYLHRGEKVYSLVQSKPVIADAVGGQTIKAPALYISGTAKPDLIPEKGLLHEFDASASEKVDQFIKTYQEYYGIPGVSLALIKDGKLVYHKTYGVRNVATEQKVDENTLFEAASITKPVFAFAVQRLAERGVIDLDKRLYLYLPYPDIAYDDRYKLITARHVLTHRTGFPNWRYMNPDNKLNLKFTPGTGYGYSGERFEYLKMVVEKITGKKVEQVLKEEVITPMALYHTFFSENDSLKVMAAMGHYDMLPTSKGLPSSPGMAYSMFTEAKVFTNFMLYLMNEKGLNAQTYKTMFSKHSEYNYDPDDERPPVPTYMGMSLEIRETPYGKSFGHGGNNGDFKCQFEVYKDQKMGYAVFTNSNTSDALLGALRELLVEGRSKSRGK